MQPSPRAGKPARGVQQPLRPAHKVRRQLVEEAVAEAQLLVRAAGAAAVGRGRADRGEVQRLALEELRQLPVRPVDPIVLEASG